MARTPASIYHLSNCQECVGLEGEWPCCPRRWLGEGLLGIHALAASFVSYSGYLLANVAGRGGGEES